MTDSAYLEVMDCEGRVCGLKQTLRGMDEGSIRAIVVARDADAPLVARLLDKAATKGVSVIYAPSKAELGRNAGLDVAAAVIGLPEAAR